MTPLSSSEPTRGTSLAKLAAIFAATFVISIGVCGYSIHTTRDYPNALGLLSLIGMVASATALIVIGVTALIRAYK